MVKDFIGMRTSFLLQMFFSEAKDRARQQKCAKMLQELRKNCTILQLKPGKGINIASMLWAKSTKTGRQSEAKMLKNENIKKGLPFSESYVIMKARRKKAMSF